MYSFDGRGSQHTVSTVGSGQGQGQCDANIQAGDANGIPAIKVTKSRFRLLKPRSKKDKPMTNGGVVKEETEKAHLMPDDGKKAKYGTLHVSRLFVRSLWFP